MTQLETKTLRNISVDKAAFDGVHLVLELLECLKYILSLLLATTARRLSPR